MHPRWPPCAVPALVACAGLFVPIPGQAGLTAAAEMMNGRLAMLGLIAAVGASLATGQPLLEVVNTGLGGLLLK